MQALFVVLCFVPGVLYALTQHPTFGLSACWLLQVGEARAHSLPLGQQPQQLHRDSSAGTPDVPAASLLPHDGRKSPHGAHGNSGSSTAAAGGSSSSSADKGGGGSPWAQRTHSEQPRLHLPSEHGSAAAAATGGGGGVGSRAAAKGAGLLDPGGGGDDESHHVVMSSGALLHHLGANSHQRSSAD